MENSTLKNCPINELKIGRYLELNKAVTLMEKFGFIHDVNLKSYGWEFFYSLVRNRMRLIFTFILMSIAMNTHSNEVFYANPTKFVLTGEDTYGNEAYSLIVSLENNGPKSTPKSIEVKIYDQTLSLEDKLLRVIQNLDLGDIDVTNDAGINGSYFSIVIPFGGVEKCRKAKKKNLRRALSINNYGSMAGKPIVANIYDPCK